MGYQKEAICEICGLIIDDEEKEAMKTGRGWHSNGKQHTGYTLIREKLKELESQSAEDRKNGLRSPSPSPVKVERSEVKKRKSKSRSLPKRQRSKSRRKRSKSRSPSRGKKVDRKRKTSQSKSRR